ncbi:MAG: DUF192 domain-containing protein [Patescibacteria group bacterium]
MKWLKQISAWQVVLAASMTLAVAATIFFSALWGPVDFETGTITFPDGSVVPVEVADSPAEQRQGLMNREHMDPESGMLFVFSTPGIYVFWMKNTQVDLDFIWLSQGRVVDLRIQVPAGAGLPSDQIARIQPSVTVDAVLEVPAGFVDRHQIQMGDQLVYHLP